MARTLINNILKAIMLLSALVFAGCGSSFISIKSAIDDNSIAGLSSNPQRNFYYDRNLGDSLKLKYSFSIKGSFGATTPAIGNNYIFVPDMAGRIYSFNLETGEKAGHVSEKGAVYSSPILKNSFLMFPVVKAGGKYSELSIYDLSRGKELENIEMEGALKSEPIKVDDGAVYISENGKIYKYNYNGSQAWNIDYGEFINSSPALWKDLVIFGDFKGNVAAVKINDGSLAYKIKTGGSFLGGFSVHNGKAYAGDADGKLYCFNADTGQLIWSFDTKYSIEGFPAAAGDIIIIGNLHGDLYCLEEATGKQVWKTATKGILSAAPAVFNDYIIQPDLNKKVYFIDRATGEIHKTMEYETRVRLIPMLYNDLLILGIDNGKVLVYEIL
jgi:outer membrane protein assembly factor BamB